MRRARVWPVLLGVERTVVESVELLEEGGEQVLVAAVRPVRSARSRCSRCGRRCSGYDRGEGRRRWRGLDVCAVRCYLQAESPRVRCPQHGVVVAAVPWARPGSRHTHSFEDTCAWLAANTAISVVAALLRTTWRTVAAVVVRVVADRSGKVDLLDGLRRIGIDEIAYRKGHRYLLAVVDHDTGRLVWAAPGRDSATLRGFFDALGPQRASALTHDSADGAEWIHQVVAQYAPQAAVCLDPFHVVAWATKALDEVRRGMWSELRRAGKGRNATHMKGTRWALLKNPADLSEDQRSTLAWIAWANRKLYRAYLLKEQLRVVFAAENPTAATRMLKDWLIWARRCQIPAFVRLARTIDRFRELLLNTITHGLSNARSEATNTHLRLLTRRAYGYHSPQALIAMAMLTRGGLCPPLPGRSN